MKNYNIASVNDRVDYIILKIFDVFNIENFYWQYNNCTYNFLENNWNSDGFFLPSMIHKKNFILKLGFFETKNKLDPKININGEDYYFFIYFDSSNLSNLEMIFPTRWIFDDFEDELIMGFIINNL